MTDQEGDATDNTDQMEQIIKSNGFAYNIVFCVRNLSTSIYQSPTYVCGNNKIQILINIESKKLSISINCNGSLNDFGDLNFDFFVPNIDKTESIHFNEKSKLPFETHINFDNIRKDLLRTAMIIKESQKDELLENQQLNHSVIQKYLHPIISSTKEKIEWSISDLSEWHMSDKYDIKFADVVFILSLENNIYSFSMSFESIQGKEAFIKAKLTIHNKDPTKNIVKNIFEYITPSIPDFKPLLLSELKPEELTAENGWIIDNCLKTTVEFTSNRKKLPNLLSKRINTKDENQNVINFCRLPTADYIQSVPIHGNYLVHFRPTFDEIIGKIFKEKIRVGNLYTTFSIDVEKKTASFDFENLTNETKVFSTISAKFINQKAYDEYITVVPHFLSKDNASISFDTPYDSKTVKEGGWTFSTEKSEKEDSEDQQYLVIIIEFDINSHFENSSPFDPIELKENYAHGPNKKYDLTLEIPQNFFKSPLIMLPSILFDSRKMNIFVINHYDQHIPINAYLEGFSNLIMNGSITIVNHKNPSKSRKCQFDSFKQSSFSTFLENISMKEILSDKSDFIDSSNQCLTLKITFSTNEDSYVYLPSEPTFEKYVSYENENDNAIKEDSEFMKNQEIGNYVGLINQGATCYMNSMLQALFHLPAFRRIVYNMPTSGSEDPEKSIPLNLQRLFCEMQFSKNRDACSTENLTKSFGWGSQETFVQHDVEEFCRVLMDNLQNKLKGEPSLENSIKNLFEVKAQHAIRCMNVPCDSITKEELLDIQLNVKGCRNLEESFKNYITKEILDGDNKYNTDQYGKQDAVMCEEFVEFPPVLHLHLKRFIFDYNTMKMTKLNDYYEFPEQIDLSQFLASDAPGLSKSNLYDLYGVLVHSGGILGGHYNAYLRTSTSKQWYFFNDSHVTPVSTYKAVRANYGYTETDKKASVATFDFLGTKEEIEERNTNIVPPSEDSKNNKDENQSKNESKDENYNFNLFQSTKNGYLLIYVRHDDAPNIFAPISEESVPKHLIEYVNEHSARKRTRTCYDHEDKSFVISFTHEDDIKQMTAEQVTDFSMKNNENQKEVKCNGPVTHSQIYELAAKEYNTNIDQIRIWSCTVGNVPSKPLSNSTKDTVNNGIYITKKLFYFVQRKNKDEKIETSSTQKLVFLKFFFPGKEDPLQYLKTIIVDKSDIEYTRNICRQIAIETLGLPNDIQLNAYIENVIGLPNKIGDDNSTHYIGNGQILILEPLPDAEINPTNFEFTKKKKIENTEENEKISDEKNSDEKSGFEDDDIKVYHLSDYFEDLDEKTLIGFWLSQNSIEFEVYDLWNQMKPLFKIVAPDKIYVESVKKKIIDFANINFNFKEDSLLLFNLTIYAGDKSIQHIDTKFQHTSFENIFKVSPSELNVKNNRLYFLHCPKYNYEKRSGVISLPSIMFSFDAKSVDFQFCLPKKIEMNLYSLITMVKKITRAIDIGDGPFRFIKISQNKISDIFCDSSENSREIIKFDFIGKYRFEVIPSSQTESQLKEKDAFLVRTCYAREKQYSIDAYNQPFLFEVIKDEIFSQTLLRLKKYIGVADSDNLDSYRFVLSLDGSLYTYNKAKNFLELTDEVKLYDKCNQKSQLLILSSQSSSKSSGSNSPNKKMKRQVSHDIKIYN